MQKRFKCVVHSLEGRNGTYPVSGEGGEPLKIPLGEEVVLPECSIDILRNAKYRDFTAKLDQVTGQIRNMPITVKRFSVEIHGEADLQSEVATLTKEVERELEKETERKVGRPRLERN